MLHFHIHFSSALTSTVWFTRLFSIRNIIYWTLPSSPEIFFLLPHPLKIRSFLVILRQQLYREHICHVWDCPRYQPFIETWEVVYIPILCILNRVIVAFVLRNFRTSTFILENYLFLIFFLVLCVFSIFCLYSKYLEVLLRQIIKCRPIFTRLLSSCLVVWMILGKVRLFYRIIEQIISGFFMIYLNHCLTKVWIFSILLHAFVLNCCILWRCRSCWSCLWILLSWNWFFLVFWDVICSIDYRSVCKLEICLAQATVFNSSVLSDISQGPRNLLLRWLGRTVILIVNAVQIRINNPFQLESPIFYLTYFIDFLHPFT